MAEYLGLPDTDVNQRAEARPRSGVGQPAREEPRRRRLKRPCAQDLSTALHYACTFPGHDHPAIAKARRDAAMPNRS